MLMSARTPRKPSLQTYGYEPTDLLGVYRSTNPLLVQIPLLLLNELRDEPHNAFVQCFASQKRVRERAFRRLRELDWHILNETLWDYIVGLQSQMRQREGGMATSFPEEKITPEAVMEIGQRMREALLATMSPEERLAGLDPEELARLMAHIETFLINDKHRVTKKAQGNECVTLSLSQRKIIGTSSKIGRPQRATGASHYLGLHWTVH